MGDKRDVTVEIFLIRIILETTSIRLSSFIDDNDNSMNFMSFIPR